MAYFTLNGFAIGLATLSATSDDVETVERGTSGAMIVDRRANKQAWDVEMSLRDRDEYLPVINIVQGLGHRFSFDNTLNSSKGLTPTSGTATFGAASPSPKFGLFRALTTSDLVYTFNGYFQWTVSLWFWTGAAWQLRAQNSNGDKWQNGVKGTYAWSYDIPVASLTLPDGEYYDDLVVLPYTLPDALMEAWPTTAPWSATPYVTVSGDAVGNLVYTAVKSGQIGEDFAQGAAGSVIATVNFTLREV